MNGAVSDSLEQQAICTFVPQQLHFCLYATGTGETTETTGSENPVTGNDDQNGIGTTGLPDGLRGSFDVRGNITVGARAAELDCTHCPVHPLLEGCTAWSEWQLELSQLTGEIRVQLHSSADQQRRSVIAGLFGPLNPGDEVVIGLDTQLADRGGHAECGHTSIVRRRAGTRDFIRSSLLRDPDQPA